MYQLLKIFVCFCLLFCTQTILAATATAQLTVNATVINACTVAAGALPFGNYDPTSATPLDGASTPPAISVTCTIGESYSIGLNGGAGGGSATNPRVMTGTPGGTLNYDLFQDSGRLTLWGNTSPTNTVNKSGTGVPQTSQVFGRIPALQASPAGAYQDMVTITVSFTP